MIKLAVLVLILTIISSSSAQSAQMMLGVDDAGSRPNTGLAVNSRKTGKYPVITTEDVFPIMQHLTADALAEACKYVPGLNAVRLGE